MKSKSSVIRILYASSEQSADLYYLTGVFVPDPFLCFVVGRRSTAVVNRLEYGRVKAQSQCDEVLLLEAVQVEAAEALQIDRSSVGPAELMRYFAQQHDAQAVEVPELFPAVYYAKLLEAGLQLRVGADPFFPAREIKTDVEAKALQQGNAASAAGIRAAEATLRAATIVGNRLKFEGRTLTSERLRIIIDQACLAKGAVAHNTIVAGGKQGCDPHEVGHGPLKPHELIIVDVFPRVQKTGYHGDMTRTFLKGRANDAQRALVDAVRSAQQAALASVKAGVSGATVHRAADDVFQQRGYRTEQRGDGFVGFIHSTGHGLGLEVHESPRVSLTAGPLHAGHVITIEPGLYYPEVGGCRIEDVVRVTTEGSELLSSMHYRWEIK
ncbi:MAG TPA: peptidase M24 [Opitutae bacterium]|nr:peptidase M24 [Opitutae bacterium]